MMQVIFLKRGMLEEERRDRLYFRGFYPENLGIIQDTIEEACDKLEYEGSILFDEYPDKNRLLQLLRRIMVDAEAAIKAEGVTERIVEIMLIHEVIRRRIRWRRYKKDLYNN